MFGRPRPRHAQRIDRLHPPAGFSAFLQDEFVDRLVAAIGHKIANVRYWDGKPSYDGPPWEARSPRFDVCDGVELDFADGQVLSIQGNATNGSPGLVAFSKSVLDLDPYYSTKGIVWDVSTRSRWVPLLGRTLDDVCIYAADQACPSEVELVFNDGSRVALLSATIGPGESLTRPGENMVVLFDEPTARALKVGSYGPSKAIRHPGNAPTLDTPTDGPTGLEPELGG